MRRASGERPWGAAVGRGRTPVRQTRLRGAEKGAPALVLYEAMQRLAHAPVGANWNKGAREGEAVGFERASRRAGVGALRLSEHN